MGPIYFCISADPRSSKHYKSGCFEIKSTWITDLLPSIATLLAIICGTLCVNKFKLSLPSHEKFMRVIAMHVGKGLFTSHARKCGSWCKTHKIKNSIRTRFPNFDAGNAWQMGHNLWEGFFLGQELYSGLNKKNPSMRPGQVHFPFRQVTLSSHLPHGWEPRQAVCQLNFWY